MHGPKQKFPVALKFNNVPVTIYRIENRGREMFTIAYREHGKRKREVRKKLADAKSRAFDISFAIAKGRDRTPTESQIEILHDVLKRLEPIGVPLYAVVDDYLARQRQLVDRPVADIVGEMLQDKKQNGSSVRYIQSLRSHLTRFAEAFHCNIGSVTAKMIEEWLTGLSVGPRARNNIRMSVVTLFRYARKHGCLPKDQQTEADVVDKVKDRGKKIELLRPAQMAKLMAKAQRETALYLALAGFAGIRAAEILRLEWKDFNFTRGHITVAADKAKTATRRLVPILANLAEFLRPYHGAAGRLFKAKSDKLAIAWAKNNGVNPWPINCLRHSFASYRLAATADAARVALELGNSPSKLFSNYRELADEHDAAAWFAISPKRPKNVVVMATS